MYVTPTYTSNFDDVFRVQHMLVFETNITSTYMIIFFYYFLKILLILMY